MKTTQTVEPPSILHAIDTDDREASLKKAPDASNNFKFNTSHSTVIQQAFQQADASVVNNEAAES